MLNYKQDNDESMNEFPLMNLATSSDEQNSFSLKNYDVFLHVYKTAAFTHILMKF